MGEIKRNKAKAWPIAAFSGVSGGLDFVSHDSDTRCIVNIHEQTGAEPELNEGKRHVRVTQYASYGSRATGRPNTFRRGRVGSAVGMVSDDRLRRLALISSLWAPLFEEGVILALGAQIEARLGVADTRPQAFAE